MEINKKITLHNRTIMFNKKNEYIVIHYVGAISSAKANAYYFYNELPISKRASANYFVDEKEIWQCVDDRNAAWHVGGAKKYYNECRNGNSIGIEMCCKKDSRGNWYFEEQTIENTIKLTRYLMKKYNIGINNVVRHYDVTRKNCPEPFVRNEKSWIDFKKTIENGDDEKMLQELIDIYGKDVVKNALVFLIDGTKKDDTAADWAKKELKEAVDLGITDGINPEKIATRQEVAIMVKRAITN